MTIPFNFKGFYDSVCVHILEVVITHGLYKLSLIMDMVNDSSLLQLCLISTKLEIDMNIKVIQNFYK